MWSYPVLLQRRSSTVFRTILAQRCSRHPSLINRPSFHSSNQMVLERCFSSGGDSDDNNSNNDKQRGSTGRGGSSDARGGGGGGGWGRNSNHPRRVDGRNRPSHTHRNHPGANFRGGKTNNNRKPNFSEKFLEPAARGELKNHQSGIPRLANRRPKGQSLRGTDPLLEDEVNELLGYDDEGSMDEEFVMTSNRNSRRRESDRGNQRRKTGTIDQGSKLEDLNPQEYEEVMDFLQMYEALEYLPDTEEYYWNESDYDNLESAKKEAMFDKLMAQATRDADGNFVADVDDETFAMFEGHYEDEESEQENKSREDAKQDKPQKQQRNDPNEIEFVMDAMGIKGNNKPPIPEEYDIVAPLNLKGPSMHDFVESMFEHPTKFGQLRYVCPHPESTREPVPDLPPSRRNPPPEFIEANKRFIYVWGFPSLMVEENPGDVDNPVHAMEIQKTVATLFDVPPEAVYPSSVSSAFVGFSSKADQRFALEFGPKQKIVQSPVIISKYTLKEGNKKSFSNDELDRVVLLQNLPEGLTPSLLAATLFPVGGDTMVYGNLQPQDFVMLSPHSAVLRFESAEMAENAVNSTLVDERLIEFGQHRIRYSKARRELVFTGKHTGPLGTDPERTLGHRLIVDGDMPKKDFFLSHAAAVHLRNLDPSVSKQEISDFFQSCCAFPQDVEGSIEFVTCYEGLPTGKAYVGFDEVGEAEAAMAMAESNGRLHGLKQSRVIMKRIRDAIKVPHERRPARDEEHLLDSLDNWEQYVDSQDLEELLEHGISKEALNEALRAMRYKNPSFASLDQAKRSEALRPEKEAGGMYRDLVQTYIATLKECISTPENPGPIYESLFFPDEEMDTEIFEKEPIRQAKLHKLREVP